MANVLPILLGIIILGVAVAVAAGAQALFSSESGWDSLASSFRVDELPEGQCFRSVSGAMSSVNFQRMWTVVVNSTGFGLSIRSVFGKAPSLFIPWSSVESVIEGKFLFKQRAIIRVHGQWSTISIYGEPGIAVAQTYEQLSPKRAL